MVEEQRDQLFRTLNAGNRTKETKRCTVIYF